jgi:hypothetical protein
LVERNQLAQQLSARVVAHDRERCVMHQRAA